MKRSRVVFGRQEDDNMVLSVNTNIGAMLALQHLNNTNMMMEKTQLAITTGLRVNGPKDDASTYAIAQNMRGDIVGLGAVKTADRKSVV